MREILLVFSVFASCLPGQAQTSPLPASTDLQQLLLEAAQRTFTNGPIDALARLQPLIAAAERAGDQHTLALAELLRGIALMPFDDAGSQQNLASSERRLEQIQDFLGLHRVQSLQAEVWLDRGQVAAAEEYWKRALAALDALECSDAPVSLESLQMLPSWPALPQGACATEDRSKVKAALVQFFRVQTLRRMALYWHQQGQHEKAFGLMELALVQADIGALPEAAHLHRLGQAEASLDRHQAAIAYFQQALMLAREEDEAAMVRVLENELAALQAARRVD